jgi:predicted GNAT family acetyltransferase
MKDLDVERLQQIRDELESMGIAAAFIDCREVLHEIDYTCDFVDCDQPGYWYMDVTLDDALEVARRVGAVMEKETLWPVCSQYAEYKRERREQLESEKP